MMAAPDTFQIVLPEKTTNIVTNPSVEKDTTGWTAVGSTISRVTDQARFGRAALQVVTDGSVASEGAYFRADPSDNNKVYAASVYVKAEDAASVRVRLKDGFNGNQAISDEVALDDVVWQRISVVGFVGGDVTDDLRIYIETVDTVETTFYVDGAQIEQKAYPTTYIDGDQPGGQWNVRKHGSVSDRLASDRSGGRVVPINEEEMGVYLTEVTGIGMPPLRHNLQRRALLPGEEFQGTKVQARSMQFTGWTTEDQHGVFGKFRSPDIERILKNRQGLIDALKPDRTPGAKPVTVRYHPGLVPLEIQARYDGGLEFDGDIRNSWTNTFLLRLLAEGNPFWREDNQQIEELDTSNPLSTHHIVGRVDGEWTNFDDGASDPGTANIVCFSEAPDGQIYIGGNFDTIGGVAANNIARWDGSDFYALGSGTDVNVLNIAVGPDGRIYIVGSFTSAGGIAGTNRVAVWDPDTETWDDLAGGLDGSAFSATFAPDGTLYVVGNFGTAGAVSAANVASWDGNGWSALGTGLEALGGPGPAAGNEVAVGPDGTVYVGGQFDDAGGVTTDDIAQFDPTTTTWSEMGSGGANDQVRALAVAPDGRVYAGGLFTTIGGTSANRAAVWNGASWSALGNGVDGDVRWIFVDGSGIVWYVGDFDEAGDSVPNTRRIARWNGSAWLPAPLAIPSAITRVRTILVLGDDLYFGMGDDVPDTEVYVPGRQTVDNRGTAESYPVFFFKRSGGSNATIVSVFHEESGKEMILTYQMAEGEEVEIDLRPGQRTVKSSLAAGTITIAEVLQNRLGELTPGSDFASWALSPGEDNNVSVFVAPQGNPTITASMRWVPYHWSADAAGVAR